MNDPKSLEVLEAELAFCIEMHEALNKPWYDPRELKADLTQRKRRLRRQIASSRRESE